METVWGVKWPIPTGFDISIIVALLLAIVLFMLFVRYYLNIKTRKSQEYQLFLFKAKRLGLSNYKIKILYEIVKSLSLKNPIRILNNPSLFESAIERFHSFLKTQDESLESQSLIYKDLVTIYEKIYHPASARRPLEKIDNIDDDQLLGFTIEEGYAYIGRLTEVEDNLSVHVFENPKDLLRLKIDLPIKVFFWRSGDAEYRFCSIITRIDKNIIDIAIPEEFERAKEIRLPDIDVNVECKISMVVEEEEPVPEEEEGTEEDVLRKSPGIYVVEKEDERINGIIFKLNMDEATVRLSEHLDHNELYDLEFEILEFMVKVKSSILSERTIKGGEVFYHTFKFEELSDAAREVLHKYMIDQK